MYLINKKLLAKRILLFFHVFVVVHSDTIIHTMNNDNPRSTNHTVQQLCPTCSQFRKEHTEYTDRIKYLNSSLTSKHMSYIINGISIKDYLSILTIHTNVMGQLLDNCPTCKKNHPIRATQHWYNANDYQKPSAN
jgi:hypothetical protein